MQGCAGCSASVLDGDAESQVQGVGRMRSTRLGLYLVVLMSGSIAPCEVILGLVCSTVSLFQGLYVTRCICHSSLSH